MRKYILLAFFCISYCLSGPAQTETISKIDNLKRSASSSHHKTLADTYNAIAEEYWKFRQIWADSISLKLKNAADSIYQYASLANAEASQVGYKIGLAKSVLNFCRSEQLKSITSPKFGIKSTADSIKWRKNTEQLLALCKELQDNELYGHAHYQAANLDPWWSSEISNDNSKKALSYLLKTNSNDLLIIEICINIYEFYFNKGDHENAFDYCKIAVDVANKMITAARTENVVSDHKVFRNYHIQMALSQMAFLYARAAGDYATGMRYLKQSRNFGIEQNTTGEINDEADAIGWFFLELGQIDSALHYLNPLVPKRPRNVGFRILLGSCYDKSGEYDSAWYWIKSAMDIAKEKKNDWNIMEASGPVAEHYIRTGNFKTALQYAKEGFAIAQKMSLRTNYEKYYGLFSRIYHHLGQNDLSYSYLLKYMNLKDSISNKQLLWKLYNYKKQAEEERKTSQLNLLNKDNQLKAQQLKQEATVKKGLIAGMILLLLLALFIFRDLTRKRKNELQKQKLENEKKQAELEMQALRAQMNPHFIFNCLSSINRFILKNESKIASNYLTRFSRLMRMVLNNSQKSLISLDDELEMLELYLEMERLRFKNSFDYAITFLNTIDSDNIFIPPLLLQPFCENAIWHGLMHKEGQGHLKIELSMENNILNCVITDNGVGRKKAEEMKSKTAEKEKSMGLKITTERLTLLNREKGIHTFYEIVDLKDDYGNAAGTKIILKVCYKESVEESV